MMENKIRAVDDEFCFCTLMNGRRYLEHQ